MSFGTGESDATLRRYDSHLPMPIVGGLKSGGVSSFCSLVRVRLRLRLRLKLRLRLSP